MRGEILFGQILRVQIFEEIAGGVGRIAEDPERLRRGAFPNLLAGVNEDGAEAPVGVFHLVVEAGLSEEGADVGTIAVIFEAETVTAPDVGDEFVPGGD